MDASAYIFIALLIVVVIAYVLWNDLQTEKSDKEYYINRVNAMVETHNAEIHQKADELFKKYRFEELYGARQQIREELTAANEVYKEKWKIEHEAWVRADAIKRSDAIRHGKASEILMPFYETFPWDPRDTRFLGTPIDLVVFDGATEESEVTIIFIEAKTGRSRFTEKQALIKDAVIKKRVVWRDWSPGITLS